jgi:energy-coupling factor transporter ATP-binding protein EcfA2
MISVKLHRDPYDMGRCVFTKNLMREFEPGFTVLVGCNGFGKTTLLSYLRNAYKLRSMRSEYEVIDFNNIRETRFGKDIALYSGNLDILANLAMSSEGEENAMNLAIKLSRIGTWIRKHGDKDVIILLDAIDSGASVDRIDEAKDIFKKLVIPDIEKTGHECYVIATSNTYAMAKDERCMNPRTGEIVEFSSYDEWEKFIYKTSKTLERRK